MTSQPYDSAPPKAATWDFVEAYPAEDQVLADARGRASGSGAPAVSPATGAALALIAGLVNASSVAEVGTGAGVSGVWLLRGMRPDGVLTTVDDDGEQHRSARLTFAAAGIPSQRVRLITGRALDVISRLSDGGYDMVVLDSDPLELETEIDEAKRLLRIGGALAIPHALRSDTVADPAQRDSVTVAVRTAVAKLASDPAWSAVLLPVGDGLAVALRAADEAAEA
ncbi:MAG: methyltransferase [Actinobacteria bacterium]|nr:methyltransferase [Actinomycetota bacterium]MSW40701.1 methyltransferase [Actinomycetota bacterium]